MSATVLSSLVTSWRWKTTWPGDGRGVGSGSGTGRRRPRTLQPAPASAPVPASGTRRGLGEAGRVHRRPLGREPRADRRPDAAAAPGDDRHLPGEVPLADGARAAPVPAHAPDAPAAARRYAASTIPWKWCTACSLKPEPSGSTT